MSDFEEKLNNFELEAQRELDDMGDMSDGSFEYQRLIPERILTLIAVIRKQTEYIENHATGLSGYNPSLARQTLQECEELLK